MIDVSSAIDAESRSISIRANASGSYNADGEWVAGGAIVTSGAGTVLPPQMNGASLKDMPEGVRQEVKKILWTRMAIGADNTVVVGDDEYRVLHRWDRSFEGGFWRAALGELK